MRTLPKMKHMAAIPQLWLNAANTLVISNSTAAV